jgi:hypothetical protein
MDNASEKLHPESLVGVNDAFLSFFRCPPEFGLFQLKGELSSRERFFRFGAAACYGNSANDITHLSRQKLFDASEAIDFDGDRVLLCFNPTQAAENLRRERYLSEKSDGRLLRSLYYLVRPVLASPVRKAIQRFVLSRRLTEKFPSWPVDCSVERIFESLMALLLRGDEGREVPFIWFWPEGYSAALMMTHDVEDDLGAVHCDMLMDLDDSVGLKAAFQFVPEERYPSFEKLVSDVRARGFEANLHDLDHDGRLYENLARFRKRAERINEYAAKFRLNGFRAGSMHRNQDWFHLLNFQYDMSVPNVSHLEPQQGGCCSVMPYFIGNLLELPLTTVQDYALFYILKEQSIDLWRRQIDTIRSHHGLISFIVHPDYIVRSKERRLYRELLRYLADLRNESGIWWALPGEINLWWRQRTQLELRKKGNKWQIEGPGSERAKVAFARLEGGKLRYRIDEQTSLDTVEHETANRVM